MSEPGVTVVIAVEYSQKNLSDVLDRVTVSENELLEVVIICTAGDVDSPEIASRYDNVVTVQVSEGSRIPQMWAEGIQSGKGSLVALTTAHCVPEENWIQRVRALEMPPDLAGVGGIFRNSPSASAMDWAVFLLRYRQFSIQDECREVAEIAADNAVYRRQELLADDDLLKHGFWEPEFHARFRERGLRLMLDPSLVVVHRNCYTFRQFAAQRVEHGTAFGSARAAKLDLVRNLALLLLSPALPLVFLGKIVSGSLKQQEYRVWTVRSFPWLLSFVACWGYGECKGYYIEFSRRFSGQVLNE